MPIRLTEAQTIACERILRSSGYTAAWLLDSDDRTETVFLVPSADLDWIAPIRSPLMQKTSLALMLEIPGTKVFIAAYRDDLRVTQLY